MLVPAARPEVREDEPAERRDRDEGGREDEGVGYEARLAELSPNSTMPIA